MPSSLRLHPEGRVVRFELASPDSYPRLNASLLEELDACLDRHLADPGCAGIVIHGSERCFAAGAEISELEALTAVSAVAFAQRGQQVLEKVSTASKPVVAAVAGYCLGGGFDLALACRWRIATPDAVFGHPGTTLGLLTGWGGTQRLPHLIGRTQALELLLQGEPVSAEQALVRGLVDEVVSAEVLLPRAVELAHRAGARTDLTSMGKLD